MNLASNLAYRKELQGAVKNERLSQAEGSRNKEVILHKKWVGYCKIAFFHGQADDLTSGDEANPVPLVKIPFLKKPKLYLSLGLVTQGLA